MGPALYVGAEDDIDEIQRRLAAITAAQGISLASLDNLHILPLAGKDAVLVAPSNKKAGIIDQTRLWASLLELIIRIRPRLLAIDNLADVYAANENSRSEARQFIGMLRGLAIEYDLAVLLLSHPSLTGINTGTGTSGSTGWSNSSRSRLYLERRKDNEGQEPDPDLRTLRLKKGNYVRAGIEIGLKWKAGRFVVDGPVAGFDKIATDAQAERIFLELVERFKREGRDVSPSPSVTYAPKVFAEHPDAKGCNQEEPNRGNEPIARRETHQDRGIRPTFQKSQTHHSKPRRRRDMRLPISCRPPYQPPTNPLPTGCVFQPPIPPGGLEHPTRSEPGAANPSPASSRRLALGDGGDDDSCIA